MEYINYLQKCYEVFSFWFIAIVFTSFLLMFLLNYLLKLIFSKIKKNDLTERIKKLIATLLNFPSAALIIFLYCLILKKEFDYKFILINSIPVAFLTAFTYTIWKVIRDIGLKPFLTKFKPVIVRFLKFIFDKIKNPTMQALKKTGISGNIISICLDSIQDYINSLVEDTTVDENTVKGLLKNQEYEELVLNRTKTILNGLVDEKDLNDIAQKVLEVIKQKNKVKDNEEDLLEK